MAARSISNSAEFRPRHGFATSDAALESIAEKVAECERLSFDDGVAMYRSGDILAIGWMANAVRERMHGDVAYFNVNRHINPTNVCVASCRLCAFGRRKGDAGTYTGGFHGLTEHFTTGGDAGAVFKATWSKTNRDYEGTITFSDAATSPATLTKGATCA